MSSSHQCQGPKCSLNLQSKKGMSRRDFLGLSAFWSCATAWVLAAIGLVKFPKPALLPDISNIFKIGKPEDIPMGIQRVIEDKKVLIVRDQKGIYALSLICTHLGCIVSKEDQGGFSCPCHGSKFTEDGDVIAGPAPTALKWLDISLHPSGKLVVNAGKNVPAGTRYVV